MQSPVDAQLLDLCLQTCTGVLLMHTITSDQKRHNFSLFACLFNQWLAGGPCGCRLPCHGFILVFTSIWSLTSSFCCCPAVFLVVAPVFLALLNYVVVGKFLLISCLLLPWCGKSKLVVQPVLPVQLSQCNVMMLSTA